MVPRQASRARGGGQRQQLRANQGGHPQGPDRRVLLHPGLAGDNVIVVDEARRLLCLNGDLFGFDDVKTVGWQSANNKHQLEFTLKSGADPLRIVTLNTVDEVKAAFARLGNSLGFS